MQPFILYCTYVKSHSFQMLDLDSSGTLTQEWGYLTPSHRNGVTSHPHTGMGLPHTLTQEWGCWRHFIPTHRNGVTSHPHTGMRHPTPSHRNGVAGETLYPQTGMGLLETPHARTQEWGCWRHLTPTHRNGVAASL
jgi:hypothetical protein